MALTEPAGAAASSLDLAGRPERRRAQGLDDGRFRRGCGVSRVEALGLKRVVLIGHSLGGPSVLEAARRMPGRLAGLVLVDSWVDFEQRLPAEEVEKYGDSDQVLLHLEPLVSASLRRDFGGGAF